MLGRLLHVVGLLALLIGLVPPALAQDNNFAMLANNSETSPCVVQCYLDGLDGPGAVCGAADLDCQCHSREFQTTLLSCVLSTGCPIAEALDVTSKNRDVCEPGLRIWHTEAIIVFCVFLAASVLFVAARLYVRIAIQKDQGMGLDDAIITTALVFWSVRMLVMLFLAVPRGLGKNVWELDAEDLARLTLYSWAGQIVYSLVNAMVKLSFVSFYWRMFPGTAMRRQLLATAAVIAGYGVAFAIAGVFMCNPVHYVWTRFREPQLPHASCTSFLLPMWVYAGVGIALDLVIIAIPLAQLRKLQLSWKQKIGVATMFCVGILYVSPGVHLHLCTRPVYYGTYLTLDMSAASITIVSAIRLKVYTDFSITGDVAASWVNGEIWSTVEVSTGMICACLPAVRVLGARLLSAASSSSRSRSRSPPSRSRSPSPPCTAGGDSTTSVVGADAEAARHLAPGIDSPIEFAAWGVVAEELRADESKKSHDMSEISFACDLGPRLKRSSTISSTTLSVAAKLPWQPLGAACPTGKDDRWSGATLG